jgi:hypothetical protein
MKDGTPLLIERTIGAGHMLVLTAPVEREWNDLAIHPLFVRFIAEPPAIWCAATLPRPAPRSAPSF